ncbi:hypothetical protein SADUNF_Sadunf04G0113800 [Salix dunnii]|uniref:Uncharacterized protein n=1 Tax=Salix dunnii TaxID=1413687 RepID=A0A835N0Z0_9ROSI|nr:hypothetical protein SADUNF_Sadunf04G0113800 [Salix dunnii]
MDITHYEKIFNCKLLFEWNEYCGYLDFEVETIELDDSGDRFLESLQVGLDDDMNEQNKLGLYNLKNWSIGSREIIKRIEAIDLEEQEQIFTNMQMINSLKKTVDVNGCDDAFCESPGLREDLKKEDLKVDLKVLYRSSALYTTFLSPYESKMNAPTGTKSGCYRFKSDKFTPCDPRPTISSYEIMKYMGGTKPVLPVPRI